VAKLSTGPACQSLLDCFRPVAATAVLRARALPLDLNASALDGKMGIWCSAKIVLKIEGARRLADASK
jgi:hypothetical protein